MYRRRACLVLCAVLCYMLCAPYSACALEEDYPIQFIEDVSDNFMGILVPETGERICLGMSRDEVERITGPGEFQDGRFSFANTWGYWRETILISYDTDQRAIRMQLYCPPPSDVPYWMLPNGLQLGASLDDLKTAYGDYLTRFFTMEEFYDDAEYIPADNVDDPDGEFYVYFGERNGEPFPILIKSARMPYSLEPKSEHYSLYLDLGYGGLSTIMLSCMVFR